MKMNLFLCFLNGVCVCVCDKKILLALCSGRSYISTGGRKEHAEQGHCTAMAPAPAGCVHHKLTFFKAWESVIVLKKVRSK